MLSCLFCGSPGPFSTIEHIVPQSLGNDEDVLVQDVCDGCQRYLGTSVEKPCLEATPFAVWRVLLGTRTKKGRLPYVRLDLVPRGGRFPAIHAASDRVAFSAYLDGSTWMEVYDDSYARSILDGCRTDVRLVLTPWHLSAMGRFLGKIGLEYLALVDGDLARTARFDEVRKYVRRGSAAYLWPVIHATQGAVADLVTQSSLDESYVTKSTECYRYCLAESIQKSETLFAFGIGTDVFLICLDHREPSKDLIGLLDGHPKCLWYSPEELEGSR